MSNLPYDPDLKEAMEKIKAILDEYQIGGSITLASRSHSEFLYHFPEWSVAQFNKSKDGIDFRSKAEDFESKEQQDQDTEASVHLLCAIRDISAQTFGNFDNVLQDLGKHMDISHKPFSGFTPHFDN